MFRGTAASFFESVGQFESKDDRSRVVFWPVFMYRLQVTIYLYIEQIKKLQHDSVANVPDYYNIQVD